MRACLAAATVLCCAGGVSAGERMGREPGLIPIMVATTPYGDPFAIRPAIGTGSDLTGEAFVARSGESLFNPPAVAERRPTDIQEPAPKATTDASQGRSTVDDGLPARPGSFKPTQTRIPGLLPEASRVVAPHLARDLEVAVGRRTPVGVYGEVGKIEVDNRPGLVPGVKAAGLGAGVSLEYKFGH